MVPERGDNFGFQKHLPGIVCHHVNVEILQVQRSHVPAARACRACAVAIHIPRWTARESLSDLRHRASTRSGAAAAYNVLEPSPAPQNTWNDSFRGQETILVRTIPVMASAQAQRSLGSRQ